MTLNDKKIGFGITASFCTLPAILAPMQELVTAGADVYPVVSHEVFANSSRFHDGDEFLEDLREITGKDAIHTIAGAETLGPQNPMDIMIIAPATGNTIGKMAHGIWDTPVLMAAKATLRNNAPVLIAMSTNDALGINGENIMRLYNTKNVYFVPFGQDNPVDKPTSMTADLSRLAAAAMQALEGRQIQPALV
ncbi:MAG: dipicolinate synthase subunit B [Clostridiales bacterium]|jgi:dipicolinate synthase subunit B|nr:dipicolinate synthase subunit B [Clostridiales bacterium]